MAQKSVPPQALQSTCPNGRVLPANFTRVVARLLCRTCPTSLQKFFCLLQVSDKQVVFFCRIAQILSGLFHLCFNGLPGGGYLLDVSSRTSTQSMASPYMGGVNVRVGLLLENFPIFVALPVLGQYHHAVMLSALIISVFTMKLRPSGA